MTSALKISLAHWPEVSEAVFVPHTKAEYERHLALLDELVDEVGNDESHPLASLMKVIGLLIEKHEDEHVSELESLACCMKTRRRWGNERDQRDVNDGTATFTD